MPSTDPRLHGLGWPQGPLSLLAKAVLGHRHEACSAWKAWRMSYNIDQTPWNEVRMLGAVAPRLSWLEPTADIAARISGIRKFLWVNSEFCLRECRASLPVLQAAGVPVMFLKGLARLTQQSHAMHERLIRDGDILIPYDMQPQAADALRKAGWTLEKQHNPWQPYRHQFGALVSHHAWSFVRNGCELDLHHFSNYLNRIAGDDEGLWERASRVQWRGYHVLVPSPTDALWLAILHGVRWSSEANADWTIDACAAMDAQPINWPLFRKEAQARKIEAPIVAGLRYLKGELNRPVPPDLMAQLEDGLTQEALDEFECYAQRPEPTTRAEHEIAAIMACRRAQHHPIPDSDDSNGCTHRKSVRFSCAHLQETPVDLPATIGSRGVIAINATISCKQAVKSPVAYTLGIKGLYLHWQDLTFKRQRDGTWHASGNAKISGRLLSARNITSLIFRLECTQQEEEAEHTFDVVADLLLQAA